MKFYYQRVRKASNGIYHIGLLLMISLLSKFVILRRVLAFLDPRIKHRLDLLTGSEISHGQVYMSNNTEHL